MTTVAQQSFIDSIAPIVQKYAPQYGIRVASPIIAQAILESAWGTSDLGLRHNYHGLKCRSGWTGGSYSKETKEEYVPGYVSTIVDTFRTYPSREAGIKGYFEFLFETQAYGRYDNLRGITDPYEYLRTIKADGYATTSNYVQLVSDVIDRYGLKDYDSFNIEEGEGMGIIKRKIVAPGHGNFTDPNPIYLAVHSTANPGTSAYNHTLYWSRPASQQGGQDYAVHVVSDWKEAYQCVEYDHKCWQVGNGNYTCIGIEICEATNRADFERGMEIAREAIWEMIRMKGWGVDRLRSHKWFTENYGGSDHTDPIPYLQKWGWTWDKFLAYIKEGEEDMTPEQSEKLNAIYNEVLRTDDPTGRGKEMKDHDHIKWIAQTQQDIMKNQDNIMQRLVIIEDKLAAK